MTVAFADWFEKLQVLEGCVLRHKQTFEYTTPYHTYDVELFTDTTGACYAVGVPREGRLIVYGSPIMSDPAAAVQTVIDKIRREGLEDEQPENC